LVDGYRDGTFTYFFDDGKKIKEVRNYKRGKFNGDFITYLENGNIYSTKKYKMDKYDGLKTQFHRDGTKEIEEEYNNGVRIGTYKCWNQKGKISTTYNLKNGSVQIESCKRYYEDGKLNVEFKRLDKNMYEMSEYYSNGILNHRQNFVYINYEDAANNSFFTGCNFEKGVGHEFGEEVFYSEDGKLTKKTQYFYPYTRRIQYTVRWSHKQYINNEDRYTEEFSSSGIVIKKCGQHEKCVPGNDYSDITLLEDLEDGD